jgi:dihydropteroate synthase
MEFKDTFFSRNLSINCSGKLIDLTFPKIMAILNLTPDSFYDGGKYTETSDLHKRIDTIYHEGADIIDLGGFSSRPGASEISQETEIERLRPALEYTRKNYPDLPVSIDTFRLGTAKKLYNDYGIDIINDITGGDGDPDLINFAAEKKLAYVIMHMKGNPKNMQKNPEYKDVVNELLDYFDQKNQQFLKAGINDVIIDPGFGFGKTTEHNFTLLSALETFKSFELPVLVGISRKSMIYKSLNIDPENSLNGTTALHMYALQKGANILRVHDVAEAKETIRLNIFLNKEEKKP